MYRLYVCLCVGNYGFVMAIMAFHWLLWVLDDDYGFLVTSTVQVSHGNHGFSLEIIGFQWQLWVFIEY